MIIGNGQYFHKDFIKVLDTATSDAVSIPTYEQKVKMTAHLRRLDSYIDMWKDVDIHYEFKHDADINFSRYNWKDAATFKLTNQLNAPLHTDNGGATGEIAAARGFNTGYIPDTHGVKYTLNEAGFWISSGTVGQTSSEHIFGASSSPTVYTNRVFLIPRTSGNLATYTLNANSTPAGANTDGSGFYHGKRIASNEIYLYRNGTLISGSFTNSTSRPVVNVLIFNEGGQNNGTNRNVRSFGMGASITGKEAALSTEQLRHEAAMV